jgi:hypothetical protein
MAIASDATGSLLTEKVAARLLAVSNRTLQTWRCKGIGPAFVRAGRAVRYRQTDLDAWIVANTVGRGEFDPGKSPKTDRLCR